MPRIETKEQLLKGEFYYVVKNRQSRKFRYEGIAQKYHDGNDDTHIFVSTKDNDVFIERNLSNKVIFSTKSESSKFIQNMLTEELSVFNEVYAEYLKEEQI